MSLRHILLGLLSENSGHGCGLRKDFLPRLGHFRNLNEGKLCTELARGLSAEVLCRTERNRRLLERLLSLGEGLSDWWDRFFSRANRYSLPKDFPVGILMNDSQILYVNQKLRSFQLDRIALSLLEGARRGPDSPQPANRA